MKLLDLFCCQGGAGEGYRRAGFDVTGVDINPQPRNPHRFIQADALEFLEKHGHEYDVIHASPPCQAHSDLQKQSKRSYPELIAPTRALLKDIGQPYVIENVEGAPLIDPIKLCGAGLFYPNNSRPRAFPRLRVIRHRLFESTIHLRGTKCPDKHPLVFTYDKRKSHYGKLDQDTSFVQVTGGGNCTVANKAAAMGIDWMDGKGLNQAIPPAYTEYIGRQILKELS